MPYAPPRPTYAHPAYAETPSVPRAGDRIGFTAPTVIYDKMRAIESLRQDLGTKITNYSPDPAFVRAWQAFEQEWTPFYHRYQSDAAKLGAILYTDDLNRQVDSFQRRIDDFYRQYQSQHQANGQPVPRPAAPPLPFPVEPGPSARTGLPWWFWTLFGVGIVGAGYAAYRYYVGAQAAKHAIRSTVLPGLIGPRLASAAGRDPEASPWPRTLEDFAMDPRAAAPVDHAYVYRPYVHPHLLRLRDQERRDRASTRYTYAPDEGPGYSEDYDEDER